MPGLWEELAFRGLTLSNLQRRYHPWVAILICSVFFCLYPITNLLLQDLAQVPLGMILAASVSIVGATPWSRPAASSRRLSPTTS